MKNCFLLIASAMMLFSCARHELEKTTAEHLLERMQKMQEKGYMCGHMDATLYGILWLHRFVSPELWGECFWNQYSALWYCSGFLGYLVLAHYIRVHLKWSQQKKLTIGAICFIMGGLFTAWSFWWKAVPGVQMETPTMEWAWEFCTPNVLLATFGAFLLFSCIQKAPRWINGLAKLSFGMYLMHIFFLTFIAEWIIGGDVAHPQLPVWMAIPVIALLTFLCCAITTKLLSLLPGSKYIVG